MTSSLRGESLIQSDINYMDDTRDYGTLQFNCLHFKICILYLNNFLFGLFLIFRIQLLGVFSAVKNTSSTSTLVGISNSHIKCWIWLHMPDIPELGGGDRQIS